MFNMNFYSVSGTPGIIHQNSIPIIHAQGNSVVIIIDRKLVTPIAANRSMEITFKSYLSDKNGVIA